MVDTVLQRVYNKIFYANTLHTHDYTYVKTLPKIINTGRKYRLYTCNGCGNELYLYMGAQKSDTRLAIYCDEFYATCEQVIMNKALK